MVNNKPISQQSSSAQNKPVVRRVEKNEPIIFDLRERHEDSESHEIRAIHFYIGDDDDDGPWKGGESLLEQNFVEVENEKSKVRRLRE